MSKTIEGVPESITRKQFVDMIASLGIDPQMLTELRFEYDCITIEVFSKDANGKAFLSGPNELARDLISIPVVDK